MTRLPRSIGATFGLCAAAFFGFAWLAPVWWRTILLAISLSFAMQSVAGLEKGSRSNELLAGSITSLLVIGAALSGVLAFTTSAWYALPAGCAAVILAARSYADRARRVEAEAAAFHQARAIGWTDDALDRLHTRVHRLIIAYRIIVATFIVLAILDSWLWLIFAVVVFPAGASGARLGERMVRKNVLLASARPTRAGDSTSRS